MSKKKESHHWNAINGKALKSLLEFILEVKGVSHGHYGRVYKDEIVEIQLRGQCRGLEVERVENRNPVLIWDEKGVLIRTHGELTYIRDHIAKLAREILGGK